MGNGVRFDLVGYVVGEVVGQTADDLLDSRSVSSREPTDEEHG